MIQFLIRILVIGWLMTEFSGRAADTNFFHIATGPFQPSWNSLTNYQVPEWFRDAKFGIWAHWGAQCEPEDGDWYARGMYQEGSGQYEDHLAH